MLTSLHSRHILPILVEALRHSHTDCFNIQFNHDERMSPSEANTLLVLQHSACAMRTNTGTHQSNTTTSRVSWCVRANTNTNRNLSSRKRTRGTKVKASHLQRWQCQLSETTTRKYMTHTVGLVTPVLVLHHDERPFAHALRCEHTNCTRCVMAHGRTLLSADQSMIVR